MIFQTHVDAVQLQIVGNAMALATTAELADDGLRMWFWVAFLAGRDGFVAAGMAFGAGDVTMFGSAVGEQGVGAVVACPAVLTWGVGGEVDFKRHMGLVAILAGLLAHALNVRFVAIETWGAIAVRGVAGRAVKGGMNGWVLLELFQLAVMAGGTGGGHRS